MGELMNWNRCRAVAIAVAIACHASLATAQVDQQLSAQYFQEAQALCERDGGKLWGVSICAPMVIYDRATQTIATSRPQPAGPLPPPMGFVNAPLKWGDTTWAAFVWEYFAGRPPRRRKELFLHEMFHGVQAGLGVAAPFLASEHLDNVEGRYWLRLEWHALDRALGTSGEQRRSAVRDALAFRHARRLLFPAGAEPERAQEITEGLAAYTATVLVADTPADAIASARDLLIVTGAPDESFVRTFAYLSGPAYGVLLDAASPGWPRRVRNTDDLGLLLANALGVEPATDVAAAALRHRGAEVRASEEQREQQQRDRLAELRRRFVDGPVLVIRGGGNASSDSRGAIVLEGAGTVYFGEYRASVAAGMLEARDGVLVASDGSSRQLPGPVLQDERTVVGDGWRFVVAPGWMVRPGPRPGDYQLIPRGG
jgi:hypothetical protein